MSKMLSQLVGVPEQLLGLQLKQLESASGAPSIDVRLTAEIIGKVHLHVRSLGLDPDDTTPEELYHALLGLVELHDRFLVRRIGGTNTGDVADLLPRIQRFVEKISIPKSSWVIKPSVVKRFLKSSPPKKVMKHLGYRSVDSLLKRESISELLIGCRLLESKDWQNNLLKKYTKLTPADFENRDVEIILLDGAKWGNACGPYVQKNRHNISHLKELGTIAILPLPISHLDGITVVLLPLILYYINEIRTYSTYFKIRQVRKDFGHLVAETIMHDPARHASMAGQHIHWRTVHRHFGSVEDTSLAEIFEPHIQAEDMFWRKAETVLYKIEPALHFWHDMDFVGAYKSGQLISFNLIDNAICYVNRLPYAIRQTSHMRESLWNEIFIRYFGTDALKQQVLKQLDIEGV